MEPRNESNRIQFIDFTRGIVMMVMAWDHVTGFWNEIHGGLEGIMTSPQLNMDLAHFFSRFITHVCAPTFVFLAGTSIALMSMNRLTRGESERNISIHLLVRGIMLITLDYIVVAPSFDLPNLAFGVLACIGACMMVFSVARRLPVDVILVLSLLIILNNEFIDLSYIPDTVAWGHYLRVILHEPGFTWIPYVGFYPIPPWIGVMGIGYWFGDVVGERKAGVEALVRPLLTAGLVSIGVFAVVRYLNSYGNLVYRWGNGVMDWLYLSKYPPSLSFLLWSLGLMCFINVLGILIQGRFDNSKIVKGVIIPGRNPLFFYLTHLWLYRFRPPGQMPPFYLTLPQTLGVWAVGMLILCISLTGTPA